MKLIPLTQGQFAQVDNRDSARINRYKWQAAHDKTGTWYATRHEKHKRISMATEVLRLPRGTLVDHIDRYRSVFVDSGDRIGSWLTSKRDSPDYSSTRYWCHLSEYTQ